VRYTPLAERFERHYIPEPMSGCFIWTAAVTPDGYGLLAKERSHLSGGSAMFLAHRASWELHRGPIIDGLHVLHNCDNPYCVNPDHLFLGTHSDNMKDSVAKGRKNNAKGVAHGGAKLTEEQALEIKYSKESGAALAKRFGVWPTLIHKIRHGKAWKHLP
jgi:hypothetical protein